MNRIESQPKRPYLRYAIALAWFVGVAALWYWGLTHSTRIRDVLLLSAAAYVAIFVPFFMAPGMSRRQKAIRFCAMSFSLGFSLLLIEAIAFFGLLDYRVVFGAYTEPWESPQNRPDHDLIHVYPPHSHFKGKLQGGDLVGWRGAEAKSVTDYDVRNDQNGFRNDPDPVAADLIVVGDSFVEAPHVPVDQTLTKLVAESLGVNGVNLGRCDYGPDQELVVLKRYGAPLKPKVCVWVFFEGNDLENTRTYRELREDPSVVLTTHTSPIARTFTRNASNWLIGVTHPKQTDYSYSGMYAHGVPPQRIWFGYPGKELTPHDEDGLKMTEDVLRDAFATCQQAGMQMVVVYAPIKFRVYGQYCEFDEGAKPRDWIVNDLPSRFRDIVHAISSDIAYFDPTPSLQQAAANGQLLFEPDDSHWSPAGHAFIASRLCDFLRATFPKLYGAVGAS